MTARPASIRAAEPTAHPRLHSDHYQEEYVALVAAKWDELIDWERRAAAEGDFFIDQLAAHGARTVLDVATGTGFHSVRLLKAGFDVTSVDGSAAMLRRAVLNARRHGQALRPVQADWRWLGREVEGPFDAIVCLGNSFTHLFEEADRRRALAWYHALLAPGGVLILDQRNYDALIDRTNQPGRRFYYCGMDVSARPISVENDLARFRYEFSDGTAFHLDMFPLRQSYVRQLLDEAGFGSVRTYGDFKPAFSDMEPDFFIHIARKSELLAAGC